MKKLLLIPILVLCGCSTLSQSATGPDGLANLAVSAVAKHYGGAKAGELASNGLSALGQVAQGYINKQPPIDIITQAPGVKGLGKVAVDWLVARGVVTQTAVNNIHKAAELASTITEGNK